MKNSVMGRPKELPEATVRYTSHFLKSEYEWISDYAASNDISKAQILREALNLYKNAKA